MTRKRHFFVTHRRGQMRERGTLLPENDKKKHVKCKEIMTLALMGYEEKFSAPEEENTLSTPGHA